MIVNFSLENWMSFKEQISFSMVASREQQHSKRLPEIRKYRMKLLPIASIYGGNASGKTNFFKALSFAKRMVVNGTQPDSLIAVEPFLLDSTSEQPTRFKFELLIDDMVYEFSFSLTKKAIMEEKLVLISSTREKLLYHRINNDIKLGKTLEKDDFLNFAFKGTRENQLYLTNSVSQKLEHFKPVYDWFKNSLVLVAPDMRFGAFEGFIDEDHPLYTAINDRLFQLDTGITHLGGEVIPFDSLPESLKVMLQEEVKEGMAVRVLSDNSYDRIIVTRKGGELVAKKLVAYHPKIDGSKVRFDLRQESDGSQRVMDLLPAFLDLSKDESKKVYIIDELDRSLHTLLTRRLIELYLGTCSPESRSQLLFTTHDVLLMDQQLFRRDEMWVTERDESGVSSLTSFSEYKDVRNDKDIRKSYLQGRLGGIPYFLADDQYSKGCISHEKRDGN